MQQRRPSRRRRHGWIGPQGKKAEGRKGRKHHHMASVGENLKARLNNRCEFPGHKQSNLQSSRGYTSSRKPASSREPVAAASNRRRHHLETAASFPPFPEWLFLRAVGEEGGKGPWFPAPPTRGWCGGDGAFPLPCAVVVKAVKVKDAGQCGRDLWVFGDAVCTSER
jgi:hypothetical protein